jgi:hypothetical protein
LTIPLRAVSRGATRPLLSGLIVADGVPHAGSVLSDAELARLSSWPDEIADDDLVSYFTLTSDDLGWLGSNVRVENWLGAAVQLCALPWLGWIPDELSACPSAAVRRLAGQLRLADGFSPTRAPSTGSSASQQCPRLVGDEVRALFWHPVAAALDDLKVKSAPWAFELASSS